MTIFSDAVSVGKGHLREVSLCMFDVGWQMCGFKDLQGNVE